ncbi:hypothetical protein HJC23_008473 [Cyclotella cryptica]|uniref:Uncharacterized protein n=1 Tax=Cyclotella cryptica TaxID=29204 RepID=A0ABD3QWR1_9STRA
MGNPLYGDDLGGMCFNPAKNWQMQFNPHPVTVINGWYDSRDFIQVNTTDGAQTIQMIGIGEYGLQGDGVNAPRKAVALQIENGLDTRQYVSFNSAKGANFQDVEAPDQVTIVEYTGTGYGISSLKGYITQGNSYITAEGRIISAECINTGVTPSLACVCVRESNQSCPSDCSCTPPSTPILCSRRACKASKVTYGGNI